MAPHPGMQLPAPSKIRPIFASIKTFSIPWTHNTDSPQRTANELAIAQQIERHIEQLQHYYRTHNAHAIIYVVAQQKYADSATMPLALNDIQKRGLLQIVELCYRERIASLQVRSIGIMNETQSSESLTYYTNMSQGHASAVDYIMRHEEYIHNPFLKETLVQKFENFIEQCVPNNMFGSVLKYCCYNADPNATSVSASTYVIHVTGNVETYFQSVRRTKLVLNKLSRQWIKNNEEGQHFILLLKTILQELVTDSCVLPAYGFAIPGSRQWVKLHNNVLGDQVENYMNLPSMSQMIRSMTNSYIKHDGPSGGITKIIHSMQLYDSSKWTWDDAACKSMPIFTLPYFSLIRKFSIYYMVKYGYKKNDDNTEFFRVFLSFWLKLIENLIMRDKDLPASSTPEIDIFNEMIKKVSPTLAADDNFLKIFNLSRDEYERGIRNALQLLALPIISPDDQLTMKAVYKLSLLQSVYENSKLLKPMIHKMNTDPITDDVHNALAANIRDATSVMLHIADVINCDDQHFKILSSNTILFDKELPCHDITDPLSTLSLPGKYAYIGASLSD